ncbi:MAG: hypothetical protein LLG06_07580 [Desulfobacteraceae bacterium]|nr:hypothetical protein [Desulfobacteraceae bacterium]
MSDQDDDVTLQIKFSGLREGRLGVKKIDIDHVTVYQGPTYDIKLYVNKNGYVTKEPTNLVDAVYELDPNSPQQPASLIHYRVRLVKNDQDGGSEPEGCKLVNGRWYCP